MVCKDRVGAVQELSRAHDLSLSPDGSNIYVAANGDHSVVWFGRNSTSSLGFGGFLKDGVGGVDGLNSARDVAVSPDSKNVYNTAYNDNAVAGLSVMRPRVPCPTEGTKTGWAE